MNKVLKFLSIVFPCVAMGTAGLYLGYTLMSGDDDPSRKPHIVYNGGGLAGEEETRETQDAADVNKSTTGKPPSDFITADTKLIYEYFYRDTGKTQTSSEDAPYHMINKTREELEEALTDWEILAFSQEEVTLRKVISGGGGQKYTVGVQNGYVAVFYQQSVDGSKLKEVTDTPLSALPEDEQNRLNEGIPISGEDELMRILEDYSS